MAALEAATQPARVRAPNNSSAPADAGALGGRVKPGHGELGFMMTTPKSIERHTIAVLVDNEAGVLARVIGLFSGRGYNIESLTVAEVDHAAHTSRVTIVTSGTPAVIEQIEAQLRRLVAVH